MEANDDSQRSAAAKKEESLREKRKPNPTKKQLLEEFRETVDDLVRKQGQNRQLLTTCVQQITELDNMMAAVFEEELGLDPTDVNDLVEEYKEKMNDSDDSNDDDDDGDVDEDES